MEYTWNFADQKKYAEHVENGMPPVIISVAITGTNQKTSNPAVPVSADEQANEALAIFEAGASIVHFHARKVDDPAQFAHDIERYSEINELIRSKAPMLVDNSQGVVDLPSEDTGLLGTVHYVVPQAEAKPDIMALNPGPMTFRGGAAYTGGGSSPSKMFISSFDDAEYAANRLRENGVKPQVFIYHPGHLDVLDYLISRDAIDKPYFLQLVFGQESGISTSMESFHYTIRNIPEDSIFQTCALGLEAVQVNTMAILTGGHVRTGLEDCLHYQRGELAESNVQLVNRIKRLANDLGRKVATVKETKEMLGID
jgi:3-keto-5-aminohexanoate cleavage enzyme